MIDFSYYLEIYIYKKGECIFFLALKVHKFIIKLIIRYISIFIFSIKYIIVLFCTYLLSFETLTKHHLSVRLDFFIISQLNDFIVNFLY